MPDDQQPSAGDPIDAEVVPADEVPAGQAPVDLTPVPLDTGYTAAGVPTFDSVREKIENRFGTAIGAVELAEDTPRAGRWPSSTRRGSRQPPSGSSRSANR